MELEELPGVGPATAEKLREAGFKDMVAIAAARPTDLKEIAGISEGAAAKIISAAKDALDIRFLSGAEVLEKRKHIKRITTNTKAVDALLGGGIETQAIYEFYGEFGSGKTQMCHQLSVNVQLPESKGGLGRGAVYIDTENTFRPERIISMAEGLELDPEKVLENVHVARAYNSDDQVIWAEKAGEIAQEEKVGLIIVDSLTAHFRAEYSGRGALADRQQRLNRHMHALQKIADVNNLAIVVTNQVMARPDVFFGDPTAAIGGHIVGHTSTFRIYLRKSKGDKRVARLIDSPNLPEGEAVFRVTQQGLKD